MGDLTRNFSRKEFACHCCGVTVHDPRLSMALQKLRDMVGVPISISSGYRCRLHNTEVGGKPRSLHLAGCAADIVIKGLATGDMIRAAHQVREFRYSGIIFYAGQRFIHVDVGRAVPWQDFPKIFLSHQTAINPVVSPETGDMVHNSPGASGERKGDMSFKDKMGDVFGAVKDKVVANILPIVVAAATPALKRALGALKGKGLALAREEAVKYRIHAKKTDEWWDDILGDAFCALLGCAKAEVIAALDAKSDDVAV
ncbi:MAG: D-Ala-D-Ala carboxypeptidase family metallohydrolase [Verrucomicrobiota bacterium]